MKIIVDKELQTMFAQAMKTPGYRLEALKLEITESLYLAMEERKITRAELAKRMGTSRAYITKLLQGDANFTLETLDRIAQALGCKLQPPLFQHKGIVPATYKQAKTQAAAQAKTSKPRSKTQAKPATTTSSRHPRAK